MSGKKQRSRRRKYKAIARGEQILAKREEDAKANLIDSSSEITNPIETTIEVSGNDQNPSLRPADSDQAARITSSRLDLGLVQSCVNNNRNDEPWPIHLSISDLEQLRKQNGRLTAAQLVVFKCQEWLNDENLFKAAAELMLRMESANDRRAARWRASQPKNKLIPANCLPESTGTTIVPVAETAEEETADDELPVVWKLNIPNGRLKT